MLVLRIRHTERSVHAARIPRLRAQLADLVAAFDHLAEELSPGSRRFALYKALKFYEAQD